MIFSNKYILNNIQVRFKNQTALTKKFIFFYVFLNAAPSTPMHSSHFISTMPGVKRSCSFVGQIFIPKVQSYITNECGLMVFYFKYRFYNILVNGLIETVIQRMQICRPHRRHPVPEASRELEVIAPPTIIYIQYMYSKALPLLYCFYKAVCLKDY